MDQSSRKRKPKEDLGDEEHEVKQGKEFESWEDLEELMKTRVLRGKKCRRADEGPLDLFIDVW